MRWESRTAMEKRVITGNVGPSSAFYVFFPFGKLLGVLVSTPVQLFKAFNASPLTFQALYQMRPAFAVSPSGCLPSTGCVGWRDGKRARITNPWLLLLQLNSLLVLWRKSLAYNWLWTSTSLFASQQLPLSSVTGLDRQVVALQMDTLCKWLRTDFNLLFFTMWNRVFMLKLTQ